MAVSRVSAETSQHDGVEVGADLGIVLAGGLRLVDEALEEHVLRLADEGGPAGQQLVQHAPDRVEVTAAVGH